MRTHKRRVFTDQLAQVSVEMAMVVPVLLALALIGWNVLQFSMAAARFDRVAADIVLAQGISAERAEVQEITRTVRSELTQAMRGCRVEVDVAIQDEEDLNNNSALTLVAPLRTFQCTMTYEPWPQLSWLAGVWLHVPAVLTHERLITVDPWKSAVLG